MILFKGMRCNHLMAIQSSCHERKQETISKTNNFFLQVPHMVGSGSQQQLGGSQQPQQLGGGSQQQQQSAAGTPVPTQQVTQGTNSQVQNILKYVF